MNISVLKEIKEDEYRVGMTPGSAGEYIRLGHRVLVESGAGVGSGFSDAAYVESGCQVESQKEKLFDFAEMIVKVKEPLPAEYPSFREGQILFTYLHLASSRGLTEFLLRKHIFSIAYETIREKDGSLPLLKPMSEIAGRLAVQEGAKCLEKPAGGKGLLLGGVPGVSKGLVAIVGGGVVGMNAAKMAVGLGARVAVLDISLERLAYYDDLFGNSVQTLYADPLTLGATLREADLVIGAVLVPGGAAPKLIRRDHLPTMKKGSVLVDVAIDQGGCAETSRPTSHSAPTYVVDEVLHYCVANIPGAVPLTSTWALSNVTHRYGLQIAGLGAEKAAQHSDAIRQGVNTCRGELKIKAVAEAHGLPWTSWDN